MSLQATLSPAHDGTREEATNSQEGEQHENVWQELFGIVHGLADTVGLALQAFTPSDDKAVSATTKKRLALRSIQGLKQGQASVEVLLEHLRALQSASQTWQRSMMFASKSHQELMEQIESTTEELRATSGRLRTVEAQRLAAVHDAEALRARAAQQEALIKELQGTLKAREEELETVQFTADEAHAGASQAKQGLEQLRRSAAEAEERAAAAKAALDEAKAEAAKAQGLAERHQQVVAKLTADNLVFLMQLKKAEADLAAANQERAQLRLAAERQRGPWFDQVRAGVEERVGQAMQRSEQLEAEMERRGAEHTSQLQAAEAQRLQLEEELAAVSSRADDLQRRLDAALEAQQSAEARSATADAAAAELRQRVEDLAAENRVLQESVRAMRQECTERWVSEQAAQGRVGGLEERIQQLEQALEQQAARAAALQQQLDVQAGVNRQLMARKAEVEWQLMAAMAKLDGGTSEGPVPLNLLVSGMLQVGGSEKRVADEVAVVPAAAPPSAAHAPQSSTDATAGHAASQPAAAVGAESQQSSGARTATADRSIGPTDGGRSGGPAASAFGRIQESTYLRASEAQRHSEAAAPDWRSSRADEGVPVMARSGGHQEQQQQLLYLQSEPSLASPLPAADEPTAQQAERGAANGSGGGGKDMAPPYPPAMVPWKALHGAGDVSGEGSAMDGSDLGSPSSAAPRGVGAAEATAGARWALPAVNAPTTASSPPSSVVVSSDPESPTAEVPRVTLPATAVQRAAAVIIRTGPSMPYGAGGSASQQPVRQGHGSGLAGGAVSGADVIPRRGSLHEGGDVWFADAGSSASSDDSGFLFGGVVVQPGVSGRRAGGSGDGSRPPAHHQAQLRQLQQQLQAVVESSRPGVDLQLSANAFMPSGTPADARPPHVQPPHTVRAPSPRSDDDFMYTRPSQQHASSSARPSIVMRTGPLLPPGRALAGAGAANAGAFGSLGGGAPAREDLGAGVYSILKSGAGALSPARAAASGSPVHPALGAVVSRSGDSPAALHSDRTLPPRDATYTGRAAASASTEGTSDNGATTQAAAARALPNQPPMPPHVQAGPPYFATGGALSGEAVASFVRWSASQEAHELPHGPGLADGRNPWALPAATSDPGHAALGHLDSVHAPAPPSPAYSGTVRSPRSPPHPAIAAQQDRASETGRSQGGPGADSVALEAAGGSRSTAGVQALNAAQAVSSLLHTTQAAGALGTHAEPGLSAAASARARIAMHSLVLGGHDVVTAGGSGSGGEGSRVISTLRASSSSSVSSSGPPHSISATGPSHHHKQHVAKSVRFSDDGPEDPPSHGAFMRHRAAHQPTGRLAQAAWEQHAGSPDSGPRQQPYRSQGPVEHPAMPSVFAGKPVAVEGGAGGVESASAKRYSAVAAVTAVPRPPVQP